MSKFERGDKVVCINADLKTVTVGEVYTVLWGFNNCIHLVEGGSRLYSLADFKVHIEEKTVHKFKKGDKLISESTMQYSGMALHIGDVVVVSAYWPMSDLVALEGFGSSRFSAEYFELIEDTSKHHKHHDLIIAWAKGAEIQRRGSANTWFNTATPQWYDYVEYQIKPTESPEQIEKEAIVEEMQKLQERLDKLDVK